MDYVHPEILVDTDWVEENCTKDGVRVIEIDYHPKKAYNVGHIRGATLIPWEDLIIEDSYVDKAFGQTWMPGMDAYDDSLPQDILDKKEFEKMMSKHGVENDTKIILYGDHNNWFAAYAFWLFKIYDHKDLCLMNGGRKKWEAEGREYTTEEVKVSPTKYKVKSVNEDSFRVSLDDVYDSLRKKSMRLIDIRSPAEYSGKTAANKELGLEEMDNTGHIPGAVNIPAVDTVNADGTFKSYDELLEMYQSRGVVSDDNVVTYCRLGERAAHTWVVLRYLLGYGNVANYDGSWGEWGTARGVPIIKSTPDSPKEKEPEKENKDAKKEDGKREEENKDTKKEEKKKSKGWGGRFWGKR